MHPLVQAPFTTPNVPRAPSDAVQRLAGGVVTTTNPHVLSTQLFPGKPPERIYESKSLELIAARKTGFGQRGFFPRYQGSKSCFMPFFMPTGCNRGSATSAPLLLIRPSQASPSKHHPQRKSGRLLDPRPFPSRDRPRSRKSPCWRTVLAV